MKKQLEKDARMIRQLEKDVRKIVKQFMKRFDYGGDDCWAIAGEHFGIWWINDEFWDFQDIITALKSDISADDLRDWHWETLDQHTENENKKEKQSIINLKNWIMGARYD